MHHIDQLICYMLAHYAKFGFVNKLPPSNLDIRTVTDPMIPFLDTELFLDDSRRSKAFHTPDSRPLYGRLICNHPDYLFHTKSGISIVLPHGNCRFEDEIMAEYTGLKQIVLLMPKVTDTSDCLLVTDETYALAAPFATMYDKRQFLSEYISLEDKKRKALYRFLRNPGAAQCFFFYASYLSSLMFKNGPILSDQDITAILDRPDLPPARFSGVYFDDCDVMTILDLLHFRRKKACWHMHLALYSLTHHASAWEGLSPARALLASRIAGSPNLHAYLKLSCTPQELRTLAKDFTQAQIHAIDPSLCRHILLQLLYTGAAMEESTIAQINIDLFWCTPLTLKDAGKLTAIQHASNANWGLLVNDLLHKVTNNMEVGSTSYASALALAWICSIGSWKDAFSNAQKMLLEEEGENSCSILVGMRMLSMMLEYELSHPKGDREPIHPERSALILEKLTTWLADPDSIFFPSAVILARNLVLSGTNPAPLANPHIREAVQTMTGSDSPRRLCCAILLNLIDKVS